MHTCLFFYYSYEGLRQPWRGLRVKVLRDYTPSVRTNTRLNVFSSLVSTGCCSDSKRVGCRFLSCAWRPWCACSPCLCESSPQVNGYYWMLLWSVDLSEVATYVTPTVQGLTGEGLASEDNSKPNISHASFLKKNPSKNRKNKKKKKKSIFNSTAPLSPWDLLDRLHWTRRKC